MGRGLFASTSTSDIARAPVLHHRCRHLCPFSRLRHHKQWRDSMRQKGYVDMPSLNYSNCHRIEATIDNYTPKPYDQRRFLIGICGTRSGSSATINMSLKRHEVGRWKIHERQGLMTRCATCLRIDFDTACIKYFFGFRLNGRQTIHLVTPDQDPSVVSTASLRVTVLLYIVSILRLGIPSQWRPTALSSSAAAWPWPLEIRFMI